jgi:multiple RNA-binding domain-containing protein 1
MAKYAISYFHKSFVATSRISVEAAFSKSGKNDHRPWSKHSEGSSRYDALHEKEGVKEQTFSAKEITKKDDVDEKLEKKKQEFIDVMMGGKKNSSNSFWANDDGEGEKAKSPDPKSPLRSSKEDQPDSESESSASESNDDSVDVMNTFKSEVSDMDFLRSKVLSDKANLSDDDDDNDEEDEKGANRSDSSSAPSSSDSDSESSDSDSGENENENEVVSKDSHKDKEVHTKARIDESDQPKSITNARLFVRNLPFSTTEEEIREAFGPYGAIIECHIPVDDTNRNKGYAFVKFSSDGEASTAMENLDGTPFQGRLVHIIPAREENNSTATEDGESHLDMTHKTKKELDRQKGAAENITGWNASFVRGDAVVDNLASRLGLEKGAILNVKDGLSSGDAAVRLALGETQVIEENKQYFENHGVDITSLESKKTGAAAKRSSSVILVKNLPFDTSIDELSKVFIAVGGKEPQVLLPPSRTIALIIYESNNDAKRAFRKLAYKRFKHVPLYLEWASINAPKAKSKSEENATNLKGKEEDEVEEESIEEGEGESTTIYVKNLNFRTTEDALLRVFEKEIGNIRSVRIPTKVASVKSARGGRTSTDKSIRQSMGYGFVEFKSDAAARKALSLLQGKLIDGHDIDLKISKRSDLSEKSIGEKKKPSTKIIVRNVPFQASRTEVLQLFGSFGQLKTVRLPKKFDGGHRGFAFVEFTVAKEALNAMRALSSTHLYGRHLVIEWADDNSDIDTLRTKAKRDSTVVLPIKNKKIRFE